MKTYKEQTENVLEKLELYNTGKKKRSKILYSSLSSVACMIIIITTVLISPNLFKSHILQNVPNNSQSSQEESSVPSSNIDNTTQNQAGIHIPDMKPPKENLGTANMIGLIVYKGKVYTQAEYIWCDNETKLSFIGEFLGTANGKIDEWSSKDEFDKEFASTVYGDVYTVNGYDKDFRICIPEMQEGSEFITFYERLNGITLNIGEDLFGAERLNLKANYTEVVYQLHDDQNNARGNFKQYSSITDEDWASFLDTLYSSPFIEARKYDPDLYDQIRTLALVPAHIYFKMNDGTTIWLKLYENGYVGYRNTLHECFVKMENEIFQKIYKASLK